MDTKGALEDNPSMELVHRYAKGIVNASDGKLTMEEAMASQGVKNYARRVGIEL